MTKESTSPLWQKNLSPDLADAGFSTDDLHKFLAGEDAVWDTMLIPYDIKASIAHARGLLSVGILSDVEFENIQKTLLDLKSRWLAGEIRVSETDEDSHTVIENFLVEMLGETGKKIHAGRSRNDQVLAALRLYLAERLVIIAQQVHSLIEGLCTIAEKSPGVFLPGYTHFQRAMPSTVALWALGFAELLCDDINAIIDARHQLNTSPLGSAAGYGAPYFDLPRESIAAELGFERIQLHATAVQISRGKLELHAVHALVQVSMTINRMASDLVLFNSREFSFIHLPEALTTGSSIMPQKKNPDVLEIARATVHRIVAEMHVLLSVPANLPSGYHRDLQLTKEATMRAVEKTIELTRIIAHVIPLVIFDTEKLEQSKSDELFATAVAYKKVTEGAAFRDAYRDTAGDTDAWSLQAEQPLEKMYQMSGQPGTEDVPYVRKLAGDALSRLESELIAGTGTAP